MMHPSAGEAPKPMEITPTEVAHAWQAFRKWCVERAIDAKATAMEGNVISTAKEIAEYIVTKDKLENPEKEKQE